MFISSYLSEKCTNRCVNGEARRRRLICILVSSVPSTCSRLSTVRSCWFHSFWTGLLSYSVGDSDLLWSLLFVRLWKSYHKEWRRCQHLKKCRFRPPMTVHFLTQASLFAFWPPLCPCLIYKVRYVTVKLKIFGVYGVQACAYSISLPRSPFLTIFRSLSAKFFCPGPKSCLTMPLDWTGV